MKKTKVTEKVTMPSNSIMEDHSFLTKLIVGIGEVAEITGIPQRQLRYWQEKGIIQSHTQESSNATRRFNYLEIKKVLLIKELLDEGFTLEAAAQKIAKRMETIEVAFKKFKASK